VTHITQMKQTEFPEGGMCKIFVFKEEGIIVGNQGGQEKRNGFR